jgi:hypothetical protein
MFLKPEYHCVLNYLIKVLNRSGQERSDELEGGSGEAVGSARVGVDIVAGEVTHVL